MHRMMFYRDERYWYSPNSAGHSHRIDIVLLLLLFSQGRLNKRVYMTACNRSNENVSVTFEQAHNDYWLENHQSLLTLHTRSVASSLRECLLSWVFLPPCSLWFLCVCNVYQRPLRQWTKSHTKQLSGVSGRFMELFCQVLTTTTHASLAYLR